ncbi:hypothetical protein BU25DRAFT_337868 [Macroventuria anomochaeta]|uniref:Uncharacterized protein n=1 Tax=Macroventuria anomochaeta TaxID=301207 RepID=A0ACB6S3Z8_9PLEO|nr:uncharacterized protein BU25DRAFT_337868 [Macroventuria anomochaeta]KAF2628891.1 hypothetical protein BU25DRAFT_337868 [Macroventuria anomochaeta]
MKVSQILAYCALATSAANAAFIPEINAINLIEDRADAQPRSSEVVAPDHSLERRKGGGGRGGGSSSGGSSSSGSSGRTSSSSSVGGSTRAGSGTPRAYGGGYYGGGAAVPYSAGSRTPKGLVAAPLLLGVGLLAIMPGLWLYSVYPYHFSNPACSETNQNNPNGTNTTLPVTCLCQEYSPCGCDENDNQQYLNDLVGNGSYAALNKSLVTVSDVNGTRNLVINGTLSNGTTAPGGTDDESAAINLRIGKYAGYWVMATIVLTGIMM